MRFGRCVQKASSIGSGSDNCSPIEQSPSSICPLSTRRIGPYSSPFGTEIRSASPRRRPHRCVLFCQANVEYVHKHRDIVETLRTISAPQCRSRPTKRRTEEVSLPCRRRTPFWTVATRAPQGRAPTPRTPMGSSALRNIAIIAHVDHGKTTLVDRLLQQSGTLNARAAPLERAMDSNDPRT